MDSTDPLLRRLLELHDAIVAVADAPLPSPLKEQLDAVSLAVGEPDSRAPLAHLAKREGKPDWRERLGRHLGHALEGLAVAHYHLVRVGEIENEVQRMVHGIENPPPSSTVGFGSRKLNAEYQAFVFALRRTMEYFAAAVGAYFKTDCRRIKSLADAIEGRDPQAVSKGASGTINAGLARVSMLLTAENAKSVRDRLAHEEFVFAGTFNAVWDEGGGVRIVGIVGGGEGLPGFSDPRTTLSTVLRVQFDGVASMMMSTYATLGLRPSE